MGVFHLECAASELPIVSQPVALLLVLDTPDGFVPVSLPIRGVYDSYGSIDEIEQDGNAERVFAVFRDLAKKGQLTIGSERLNPPDCLDDLLDEIRQAQVDEIWLKAGGCSLGFTLVLAPFYSAVVRTIERDPSTLDCRRAQLAQLGSGSLVRRAFGDLDLARALYTNVAGRAADEIVTGLVELVQFRRWFDTRGSWIPDPLGDQYLHDDIPPFIAKAKKELAAWPLLLEAVSDYERDFEAKRDEDDDDFDDDEIDETFGIDSAFPDDDDDDVHDTSDALDPPESPDDDDDD